MRHYRRSISVLLAVGALVLTTACEDRTMAARAVPGTVTLVLEAPQGLPPGGVTMTIGGPEMSPPIPADRAHEMFVVDVTPSSATLAVVGTAISGAIARFDVPDVTDLSGYSVNIIELVDANNELITAREGYRIVLEADAIPVRGGSRTANPMN